MRLSYSALRSVVLQVSLRNVEGEKKLRKDLKRTKVLLADAQIMLDHLESNAPSKREITQLKNQVCGRPLAGCLTAMIFTFTFTFRVFSRRFYPKRRTISTFVRRMINNTISLSVQ